MDQVEKRFCLSTSPDSLLQSQHWLGAEVQFSSFILLVNNGGNFTLTGGLSHLYWYIPVPGEVYWLFSCFLFSNTRRCRFLCTCFFWCSKFPFVLFSCFSSLEDSVRFPHEQIATWLRPCWPCRKCSQKFRPNHQHLVLAERRQEQQARKKSLLITFRIINGPIANDIECSYVRARENSVLFVSALLHAESFPLFLPFGCTLGR